MFLNYKLSLGTFHPRFYRKRSFNLKIVAHHSEIELDVETGSRYSNEFKLAHT